MTGNDVINSVSRDVRKVLGTTGDAATVLQDYVDRIHKDALHTSIYSFLNYASTSVSTSSGTYLYTLTPTNIRRIIGCYDRTLDRILLPIDKATQPIAQREVTEPAPGAQPEVQTLSFDAKRLKTQTGLPEYYRLYGVNNLVLYPTPQAALTVTVLYEQQVTTLASSSTALIIPDDGFDMIAAGVNYLANLFLAKTNEAQFWAQIYEKLKAGQGLV